MKKLFIGIIIALVICTVVGVVAKVAAPDVLITSRKSYEVVGDVSHGEMGDISKLKKGSSVTVTLEAAEGYVLPETITVTGATYEYDQTTGNLTLSNPVGQVSVEVVCVPITYTVSTTLTNGTSSGATSITYGGTATVTLAASTGYTLPSSVTVTGATYTYDSTTGVVSLSAPTGNVTISGACTANTYTVSTTLTNGTSSGATSITYGGTATVTLSASTGYTLPSSVTVTGATYTYDSTTGVVSLSAPTGNVTISGACDQVQQQPAQTYTLTITGWFECCAGSFAPVLYVNSVAPENCYYFDPCAYESVVEGHSLPFTIQGVSQIIFYNDVSGNCGIFSINGVDYAGNMGDSENMTTVVLTQNSTLNVKWGED